MAQTAGPVYTAFISKKNEMGKPVYDTKVRKCIVESVTSLLTNSTTTDNPGMLLGKIQSGKTRTFLGIIALAFDNAFDVAVVFTKGTKALAQQTLARLNKDFKTEIDRDLLHVFDVMALPEPLAEYELQHKLIIVCKKEDDNIRRLDNAIFHINPALASRNFLLIDDEADFASIGFRRTKAEGIKINKIAQQIDALRRRLDHVSVLQVTATPYSLYLQPEDIVIPATQQSFLPLRPAFTTLVPLHDKYIGGDYYFEQSLDRASVASHLHVTVEPDELAVLKKEDRRRFRIEEALTSASIKALRRSIVTFIVGGYVRRWQETSEGKTPQKYSFIVHTETTKGAHQWQEQIVEQVIQRMKTGAKTGDRLVKQLIEAAHKDLTASIQILGKAFPTVDQIVADLESTLTLINTTRVNSEKDVLSMLDESGQLKLRTPFNIFIGGQILDRGLTIANLIGFFYGRNPNRFQQDTVLQHSRMYGVRPIEDLAVTRFYTTLDIYSAMRNIHEFDSALRKSFEQGGNQAGVVFLRADPAGRVIPCSPNKILISTVTTVGPGDRFLPVGFTTVAKARASQHLRAIDTLLQGHAPAENDPPFILDVAVVEEIIDHISKSLDMDPGYTWDIKAFKASLNHLARTNPTANQREQVGCMVRRNRNLGKHPPGNPDRLQSAPDSQGERLTMEQFQGRRPALFLYRQNGKPEDGWSGSPFWWPVLRAPNTGPTVVFAHDTVD